MKSETGRKGEELAAAYLSKQGYSIETRNFHCRWGEIDIICRKGPVLVFVEVRSKGQTGYGEPEESITQAKINKIRKTAFEYLNSHKVNHREIRFDFIGITFYQGEPKINHIEGAF